MSFTEYQSPVNYSRGFLMKNDKKEKRDEPLVQMAIDPETGRDITGEVISSRLKELEIVAEDIINTALEEYKISPEKNKEIYEKYYWEIHQKLGVGSIGPATAAAGPLMYEKMEKLGKLLEIDEKDII